MYFLSPCNSGLPCRPGKFFVFFFFPVLNHSENNVAYSEASCREKKCSVNCTKLSFFLSFSLPSFLFFIEPAESSCGIQSQGIV